MHKKMHVRIVIATLGCALSITLFAHGTTAVSVDNAVLEKLAVRRVAVATQPSVAPVKKVEEVSQFATLPAPGKADVKIAVATTPKPTSTAKNRIVVPAMGVDTEILEGKTTATLNKGIWHLPGSSNPVKGGNMVISAHRYKWLPPSTKTFWNIDKVKKGDPVYVTWEGKTYLYKVTSTAIVKPSRVDILANTKTARLTLFSCTPKFTSKYRLVVFADPVDVHAAVIQ